MSAIHRTQRTSKAKAENNIKMDLGKAASGFCNDSFIR
jgi:hypothetical protein